MVRSRVPDGRDATQNGRSSPRNEGVWTYPETNHATAAHRAAAWTYAVQVGRKIAAARHCWPTIDGDALIPRQCPTRK